MANKMFGCFVSGPTLNFEDGILEERRVEEKSSLFRKYIWGEKGIDNLLDNILYKDYGEDVELILLQFYLNPNNYELKEIKKVENYRKKEKSIALSFIINNDNFFKRENDESRLKFLQKYILNQLSELKLAVIKRKLDTNVDNLIEDVSNTFLI